ncbi:hypothetical protein [Amycolatopsis sp. NPDC051372]|uniref:hypothetical protein n=1 Tax=unclassified Amycolatopsis TaxID=2618356 RepID=UPI0034222A70
MHHEENGALAAPPVHYKRAAFLDPDGEPVAFPADLMRKDVAPALSVGRDLGVAPELGEVAARRLDSAREAGFGARDLGEVLRASRPEV